MTNTLSDKRKPRVGVLRGGPSHEYDISLKSGANVLKYIPDRYDPVDIFISRDGAWHMNGRARTPQSIMPHMDIAWNALHGAYGEDGKVQRILSSFHVPTTGSDAMPSSLGLNKNFSKAQFQYHGLKTPDFAVIYPHQNTEHELLEIFQTFSQPSVVKPLHGGSSIAVTYADSFPKFKHGIEQAFKYDSGALIEEYIKGKEATGVVIEASDGSVVFSLKPYAPRKSAPIFDFDSKYKHMTPHDRETLTPSEMSLVQNAALDLHRKLGLKHYSTVDAIIHPSRGLFVLEVDTLPGLTDTSAVPIALSEAGISMSDFIDHIIQLTLARS